MVSDDISSQHADALSQMLMLFGGFVVGFQ